jgi:hypothetical protein
MNLHHILNNYVKAACALTAAAALQSAWAGPQVDTSTEKVPGPLAADVNWLTNTISPVTNPIYFEDPVIRTEIRPIFAYHRIDDNFITQGGSAELYAIQARFALTDRLALIATEDGYMHVHEGAGPSLNGWMDLQAGFKYAVIDDRAHQFILTPGITFQVPTGSEEIFQGKGKGVWNFFVSSEKGFDKFHLTGNVGFLIPDDSAKQSSEVHYSLQADYYACQWFIPFVQLNGFTVMHGGHYLPLTSEGYDVINFGSADAGGSTQLTLGGGFRSRIFSNFDLGIAYEKAVSKPYGLTNDRFTFDATFRF